MKAKTLTASLLLAVTIANPILGIVSVTRAQARPAIPQEISTNKSITSDGLIGETLQVQHKGKSFETKTPESVGKVDLSETKEALASIDRLLGQSDSIVTKQDADSSLETETNGTKVDVPKDSTKPVTIESEGEKLEITLPRTEQTGEGVEIARGVVAYASESDFSNAVQANEDGSVRMTTIIDNPNAPLEYEYKIGVQGQYVLIKDTEGGIVVLSPDQREVLLLIDKPWAKDAEGKTIETYFEIRDNTLIQVVKHNVENIVYPITADPRVYSYWWGRYIQFNKQETLDIRAGSDLASILGGALGWAVVGPYTTLIWGSGQIFAWQAGYAYDTNRCFGLVLNYWTPGTNLRGYYHSGRDCY